MNVESMNMIIAKNVPILASDAQMYAVRWQCKF